MSIRSTYRRCRFWQNKIIFSDGAHFDLGGYVNKQNCRIWATENPHAYIEKPTHPKRVTVWCRFWSRGIIGPFLFENEHGEDVTVNGDCYRAVGASQPKLHSMFCDLFLKIELSAAELMSFCHLGTVI